MTTSLQPHILIVSTPFCGHLNVLYDTAIYWKLNKIYDVTLLVLGWKNVPLPVRRVKLDYDYLITQTPLSVSCPTQFNLERCLELYQPLVQYCSTHLHPVHHIVYDFFALEAYFLSRLWRIPCTCSIPAVVSKNWMVAGSQERAFFETKRIERRPLLERLALLTDVEFEVDLMMVSDGFLLQGDVQWLWSCFTDTTWIKTPVLKRSCRHSTRQGGYLRVSGHSRDRQSLEHASSYSNPCPGAFSLHHSSLSGPGSNLLVFYSASKGPSGSCPFNGNHNNNNNNNKSTNGIARVRPKAGAETMWVVRDTRRRK